MDESFMQQCKNREEQDQSVLQVPITLGVKNTHQILRCLQNGTREVKDVILNECNIIYECKVCRNLFRSLANLLSHKRIYCTDHCCDTMAIFNGIDKDESTIIVQPESPSDDDENYDEDAYEIENGYDHQTGEYELNGYSNSDLENYDLDSNSIGLASPKIFVPSEKESRKEKLEKWEKKAAENEIKTEYIDSDSEDKKLYLEPIKGNSNAVFQSFEENCLNSAKLARKEKDAGKKLVVIIPKNTTKNAGIGDKKLGIHITREKLLAGRNDCDVETLTCFKCCTQYTSMKTLYLHMMNIHAKRRWYYPCPFCNNSFVQLWGVTRHLISVHKKSKDQIGRLRDIIKKRAFLKVFDTTEYKGGFSPKGSPGQKSSQQSKDVKSFHCHKCSKCGRIFNRKSSQINHEKFCNKNKSKPSVKSLPNSHSDHTSISSRPKRVIEKRVHKDFINSQTLKWRSANKVHASTGESPPKIQNVENIGKKMEEIINPKKLSCIKCHKKFCSLSNLRRHAAIHIGWTRFKCKYCPYRSYQKFECRAHIQKMHNVTSNTESIENLIIDLETSIVIKKDGFIKAYNRSSGNQNIDNTSKESKDNQKKKQVKLSPESINLTSDIKEISSIPLKINCENSPKKTIELDMGGKVLIPVSVPLSPKSILNSGGRQMLTRFSSRHSDEADDPLKSFSTLVTRSSSYPKVSFLPNKEPS